MPNEANDLPVGIRNLKERYQSQQAAERPRIVCLCGSTRFIDTFRKAEFDETLAGRIVLTIGCDTKSNGELFSGPEGDAIKVRLDELHKRKIDLADEVLILNVDGYIGSSTRSELDYAVAHGKPVRYLEPPAAEPEAQAQQAASILADVDNLARAVLKMCKLRGWSLHWTARGAYLHLESSELIESIRGKGDSTPLAEAADVLLVLMSITENAGIPFSDVVAQAKATCDALMVKPHYPGEEFTSPSPAPPADRPAEPPQPDPEFCDESLRAFREGRSRLLTAPQPNPGGCELPQELQAELRAAFDEFFVEHGWTGSIYDKVLVAVRRHWTPAVSDKKWPSDAKQTVDYWQRESNGWEARAEAAEAQLTALQAENEQLTVAVAKRQHGATGLCCQLRLQEKARADELQARVATLEGALRPFVAAWAAHVEATATCNSRIPALDSTASERLVYRELYRKKQDAEQDWHAAAVTLAKELYALAQAQPATTREAKQ